jgi:tetratricopeptide (TPR) repeat protein
MPMSAAVASEATAGADGLRSLLEARDFAGVLRATEAVQTAPGGAGVQQRLYRGRALEGLARYSEARACYETGLAQQPDSGRLHAACGQLAIRLGDPTLAREQLEQAVALEPELSSAWSALLHLRPVDPDGPEAARMLARALDDRRSTAARCGALFLLGQINVDAGRDHSGFTCYAQGNRLVARGLDERRRQYRIPRSALALTAAQLDAPARALPPCPALIVAGLPRSGKSLVERLLARHPAIAAGGEIAGLKRALEPLGKGQALTTALRELRSTGLSPVADHYAALPRGDARWLVDTSPASLQRLGHLALLHPETPVVLCRRSVAELGLALYFKKFRQGHGYSYGLATIGRAIAAAERLMAHWRRELPNPLAVVDYEGLVRDPVATSSRLFRELGLGPPPDPETKPAAPSPWRLFPTRSPGGAMAPDPALLGFAERFQDQLAPLQAAYDAARERPPRSL